MRVKGEHLRATSGQSVDTGERLDFEAHSPKLAVDVVVLAGSVGVDSPWAGGTPRSLLPLIDDLVITRLIKHLSRSFTGSMIVCTSGGATRLRREVTSKLNGEVPIIWHEDRLPMGTAGCIKACERELTNDHFLVVGGSVWLETDPRVFIEQHIRNDNALSIVSAPTKITTNGDAPQLRPLGIYCCHRNVLKHIRCDGFHDIKEQLVPTLIRSGEGVGTITIDCSSQEVLDWQSYLRVVGRSLSIGTTNDFAAKQVAPGIWCEPNVDIACDARIIGPAYIGTGTTLGAGSVVLGPAVIGPHCQVGAGSWLMRAVLPANQRIEPKSTYNDHFGPVQKADLSPIERTGLKQPRHTWLNQSTTTQGQKLAGSMNSSQKQVSYVPAVLLGLLFCWAFWPTLGDLWNVWQTNSDYSAGQLVPLTVLYMLAVRRDLLSKIRLTFNPLGLLLFFSGVALNVFGQQYLYASFANMGMLLCGGGLVITLIGWSGFKKIWYPLLFLGLMIPLPRSIHDAAMLPMQELGARVSETMLELAGIPVIRLGHVLEVAGHRIAVAEACNGLRLVLAFVIVTGVAAYLVRRPSWQKAVVVLSAIPIALACNILRIVATSALYAFGYVWLAEGVFHDGAGALMMPVALGLVWLELRFLSTLTMPGPSTFGLERITKRPAISG